MDSTIEMFLAKSYTCPNCGRTASHTEFNKPLHNDSAWNITTRYTLCYDCRTKRSTLSFRAMTRSAQFKARAKKYGLTQHATAQEILDLLIEANNICGYCHRYTDSLTIDHIVPLSHDGSNTIDNMIACCKSCNCHKGTKPSDDHKTAGRPRRPAATGKEQK